MAKSMWTPVQTYSVGLLVPKNSIITYNNIWGERETSLSCLNMIMFSYMKQFAEKHPDWPPAHQTLHWSDISVLPDWCSPVWLNGRKLLQPSSKNMEKALQESGGCFHSTWFGNWDVHGHSSTVSHTLNAIIWHFIASILHVERDKSVNFLCLFLSHQGTLQSKDGRRSRLLQRLHAAPPPAPPEAVRLPRLQVEPPSEQGGVFPALPLCLIRSLLQIHTHTHTQATVKLCVCHLLSYPFVKPDCHLVVGRGNFNCSY